MISHLRKWAFLYTDYTGFTESHGFFLKNSVFIRVIGEIRVQKALITVVSNKPTTI
jgi:hypothetical protein